MATDSPHRGKMQHKINALAAALMLREMLDDPCNTEELAEVSGLSRITVQRWVRTLHKVGVLYIASWEKNSYGKMMVANYAVGRRKDAVKQLVTNAEKAKRQRKKKAIAQAHAALAGVFA